MKFKPTSDYHYWWPVTVSMPNPDRRMAGRMIDAKFKMQFAALDRDEAIALAEEIAALPSEERVKREHEELIRVCRDWDEDVVDDQDRPIPFSIERLTEFLQSSWFRIGLYRAYEASLRGQAARKGN